MSGLAGLLNRVPPDWEADAHDVESFLRCGEDGWSNDLGAGFKDEVLLAALAPEMAALLIDAMAEFRYLYESPGEINYMPGIPPLLARFDQLNHKASPEART